MNSKDWCLRLSGSLRSLEETTALSVEGHWARKRWLRQQLRLPQDFSDWTIDVDCDRARYCLNLMTLCNMRCFDCHLLCFLQPLLSCCLCFSCLCVMRASVFGFTRYRALSHLYCFARGSKVLSIGSQKRWILKELLNKMVTYISLGYSQPLRKACFHSR